MLTGRPKKPLVLTPDERRQLDSLAHRSRSRPWIARRARIVLACAEGTDNKTVARRLRVSPATVGVWRARFIEARVDGLFDEPRPGAPRQITDEQIERVIIRTLETTPVGATHWSTRDMAKAAHLSRPTVHRIWQAFGLQPHRTETFKLSPDPLLIDKGGCTSIRPSTRSCCASMRSRTSKRSTGRRPCCRCSPAKPSAGRTITNGTARRPCSPP